MDSKLLGSRIRQARERIGMSQEDFAALTSRDQGAISEYENGKRRISAIDLPNFAEVLKVPLLYFYEGEIRQEDLDHVMVKEFHRLPTLEAKRTVIEITKLISDITNPLNTQ